MVINIRLADMHPIEPGVESMACPGTGTTRLCTDVEVLAQNRGRYAFGQERIEMFW